MRFNVFFPLVLLLGFLILTLPLSAADYLDYKTVEGTISLRGSEPFVELIIFTEDRDIYTLTGEKEGILKKLCGAEVRITGGLKGSRYSNSKGHIEVDYLTILDLGYDPEVEWVYGRVEFTKRGYLLIGDDQVIYEIVNLDPGFIEERFLNSLVVLIGDIEKEEKFLGKIKVKGFKVLGKTTE